jgi:hypothetical protein
MVSLVPVAGKVILWTSLYRLGNILMETIQPVEHSSQAEDVNLNLLALMICDWLTSKQECKGFNRSINILSREAVSTRPMSPHCSDASALSISNTKSKTKKPEALALLTLNIVHLLDRRLRIDQERQGNFSGRLPW